MKLGLYLNSKIARNALISLLLLWTNSPKACPSSFINEITLPLPHCGYTYLTFQQLVLQLTKMEPQIVHNTSHRMSFLNRLDTYDDRRDTQWPNISVEEGHKIPHGRSTESFATASTVQILDQHQLSPMQRSGFLRRIQQICTLFPWRDMSWMVGVTFAFGSASFVINGFFLTLPLIAPERDFSTETSYATPISGLLGGVIFVLGGYSGLLEGLNYKRGEIIVTEGLPLDAGDMSEPNKKKPDATSSLTLSPTTSDHDQNNTLFPMRRFSVPKRQTTATIATSSTSTHLALLGSPSFIWWPTMCHFVSTYHSDLVFLAGFVQFIGTIIFLIGSITAVPGVIDFSNIPQYYGASLFPATFGGVLFTIAGILQMVNCQDRWFLPSVTRLDWYIGLANMVGSIGFTLAGALPFVGTTDATLQAALASFWGSWLFMIGGALQWYHAMGNYS